MTDSNIPATEGRHSPPVAAPTPPPAPQGWALAFSGGGIRSATFCLGLARALAKNGQFKRFRWMSTVSGGGYVGSAIGRLFGPGAGADEVQRGLADDRSLFLWWLRRNGRFLLPAGAGDGLQAATSYLRGLLATHWEAGVLAGLLAAAVVLPHLLMGFGAPLHKAGTLLATPWWSLLLPLLTPAAAIYFAFWFTRDPQDQSRRVDPWIALIGLVPVTTLALTLWMDLVPPRIPAWITAGCLMVVAGLPAGFLLSRWRGAGAPQHARIRFTRWLSNLLLITVAVAIVGLLDVLSWIAGRELASGEGGYLFGGLGLVVMLLVALRAAMPTLQALAPGGNPVFSPEALAHGLGLLLSFAVLCFWMTMAQWWVFFGPLMLKPVAIWLELRDSTVEALAVWENLARWGILACVLGLYAALSGRNVDQLNRASLFPFYRSRLARAYVSVGNVAVPGGAPGRFAHAATQSAAHVDADTVKKVSDYIEGDDVDMAQYAPDQHGGPLHLVNVCINQTCDDRTGAYNADRKGINLAVSHEGFEFGTQPATDAARLQHTTLAQWVAISGAAVASGMGSLTRSGIAALTFLTGVRLGYWWTLAARPSLTAKYRATLDEWRGRFPGLGDERLYLSDGGHFDNTGIYALLKRRPALIVAADCGADPAYAFNDIENLIRKARIDYRAAVEFLTPGAIDVAMPGGAALRARLGTPDSITPEPGDAYLLLARITYEDGGVGALLLVKPRRLVDLSIDVAGYSDRDRAFPQQSTGDQFFDESQWESYCELGLRLGLALDNDLLRAAVAAVRADSPDLAAAGTLQPPPEMPAAETGGSRRERIGLTTVQKVGLGAALSALIAGWQVLQDARQTAEETHRQKQIAIQALLGREDEGEADAEGRGGSLVERALLVGMGSAGERWKAYQRVVDQLDDFGAAQGRDAQDSAIRITARAVANRCERAARASASSHPEADSDAAAGGMQHAVPPSQCIPVLASLTQPPRSAWERSVADYQTQVRNGAAQSWGSCRSAGGGFPVLALHGYDRSTPVRVQVDRLRRAADDLGFRVDTRHEPLLADYDALVGQKRAEPGDTPPRPLQILAHPGDAPCAEDLALELNHRLGDRIAFAVTTETVPSLAHGQGQLQVVALPALMATMDRAAEPEVRPAPPPAPPPAVVVEPVPPAPPPPIAAAPAPVAPPAPPRTPEATPAAGAAGGFADKRLVYVQFRGDLRREQVNALRAWIKQPPEAESRNAEVPGAERVDGTYGNSVRYFREEDRADALLLAAWVSDFFASPEAAGCRLAKPVTPLRAQSKSTVKHLEVWIAPECVR